MAGICILGITGRMGQTLLRALREPPAGEPLGAAWQLVGGVASPHSASLGKDAALDGPATGVAVTADVQRALTGAAAALDFSVRECVADNARACAAARVPLLVGTTGLDAAARAALAAAAQVIPVLLAPNTSVGVGVLAELVEFAARAFGPEYDVEIHEVHHRMKRDAPSGTALALGEVVAAARGQALQEVAVYDRHGAAAPRRDGEIGFSVQRGGDVVGEHTVTFLTAGECLEITHRATDRIAFARGALRAAEWLRRQPAGLYGMRDVLRGRQP